MDHAIMRHGVFIDECGCNIWTARNHGRGGGGGGRVTLHIQKYAASEDGT